MKTRDEFLRYHAPLAKNPDTGKLRYEPDFARDLDALLAAARAEALEEALAACGQSREDYPGRIYADPINGIARRIRALVKP